MRKVVDVAVKLGGQARPSVRCDECGRPVEVRKTAAVAGAWVCPSCRGGR